MPLSYRHEAIPVPTFNSEYDLVCQVNGINPDAVPPEMADWLNTHTVVTTQFSRQHQESSGTEMISLGRAASIPVITARWQELIRPAYPDVSVDDILRQWRTNMPENRSGRHPDELFDIAQWNFGTDASVRHIVNSITWRQRERIAMAKQYRSALHRLLTPLRYRGDVDEAQVDALIDHIEGRY